MKSYDLISRYLTTVALFLIAVTTTSAFYNPQTGRWLSRDPIEWQGDRNIYAFVQNQSITFIDPDGRKTWVPYPPPGHYVDDPPPPSKPSPPTLEISHTKPYSCGDCKNVSAAVALATRAMASGKCRKWFDARGARGESHILLCRSSCNPMTWFTDAWSTPIGDVNLAPGACNLGVVNLASLLIHELAHSYCRLVILGGESCAESAQDACMEEITR